MTTCIVCHGTGCLPFVRDVCPLCDGLPGWPETEPRVFEAGTKLPGRDECAISIVSYNVLLPNSVDGWWIPKYYRKDGEHTTWQARQALLRGQMSTVSADIACFQECCDDSFASDFAFMADLGYNMLKHEKRQQQGSPGTFWKKDRVELVKAAHKHKTLITFFELKEPPHKMICVVNCHLSGGPHGDDRLRQAEEALKAVVNEAKKLNISAGEHGIPCIFCGDLNAGRRTAVNELLVNGEVTPNFMESGRQVTGRTKRQSLGPFMHAQEAAFGERRNPATLLCSNIDAKMLNEDGSMTADVIGALNAAFDFLCAGNVAMDIKAIEKYLTATCPGIERPMKRLAEEIPEDSRDAWSVELRSLQKTFEASGKQQLTREEFLGRYERYLKEGKFWLVDYDLRHLNGRGIAVATDGPCELHFDHIYFTKALCPLGVQAPLSEERLNAVYGEPWDVLPNHWHPSDHLPVAAAFAFN